MTAMEFQGVDICLTESLLYYGFVTSEQPDEDGSYLVVYRNHESTIGAAHDTFGTGHLTMDEIDALLKGDDWISESDIEDLMEYADIDCMITYIQQADIVQKLSILSSYFGWVNIMGVEYHPMSQKKAINLVGIEEDEEDELSEEYY